MEFTVAGEPHGDDARQNTKYQFEHGRDGKVDQRVTVALFALITVSAHEASGNLGNNARDKDNEGVHNALNQRHGHHVTVGNMADFMGDDRFGLIAAHVLQQAGTDGDQGSITARTGGESVNIRRVINRHLRHRNACLARLLRNGIHQPALHIVGWLLNDFTTYRFQRHPFRHQQRNERAAKTEQQRHNH